MNLEAQIVKHLVKKYKPLAIFLIGSRARDYARGDSDWDIIILTKNRNEYLGELFMEQELDIHLKKISDIKNDVLRNHWNPYEKVRLTYDHSHGKARKILDTTAKVYARGPKKLSPSEYQARERWDKRKLAKVIRYQLDPMLFFHHLGLLFQEISTHWFELKGRWSQDPLHAFEFFKSHDKKFYNLLKAISGPGASSKKIQAARAAVKHLYD